MSVNIIKVRSGSDSFRTPRITRAVHEASLEAKEIIDKARGEAAEILRATQLERETLLAESREQGFATGLDKWNEALIEAWKERTQYLSRNESELVRLSIAVARKIIGNSVQVDPSTTLHTVREAIRSVRSERKIKLRVRADDEAMVRSQVLELKKSTADICEIVVLSDDSIELGGCIVDSDLGTIDAQISTQLQSLERALLRGTDAGSC
jgi:flagellar biosynthesis/type III secretory pathway protein FliH